MAEPRGEDAAAVERIMLRLETSRLPPQQRAMPWWPSVLLDWNFAPAWPRVAALAGAAVLGISIGFPGWARASRPISTRCGSRPPTKNVFDVDSVAGLRP